MYLCYMILGGICFALMFFVVIEIDLGTLGNFFAVLFFGLGSGFVYEGATDFQRGRHINDVTDTQRQEAHRKRLREISDVKPQRRRRRPLA